MYGPQQQPEKYILWDLLCSFIQNHQGNFILFGDLNEVRCETERFGSNFSSSDAAIFNAFIQDVGLIDLPMGGKMFTWMNKSGSKLSKLDRFLISNNVLLALSKLQVTVLDRVWSDHNPILLHCQNNNFGLPEGVWVSDPGAIKMAFLEFYKEKFSCHDSPVILPSMSSAKSLSDFWSSSSRFPWSL
ncbi:RNA-directed DNA polymerase, eukaryota, reverse transcriptase zinc-binding domain protein [Tanacetum coccineum]